MYSLLIVIFLNHFAFQIFFRYGPRQKLVDILTPELQRVKNIFLKSEKFLHSVGRYYWPQDNRYNLGQSHILLHYARIQLRNNNITYIINFKVVNKLVTNDEWILRLAMYFFNVWLKYFINDLNRSNGNLLISFF